MLCRVQIPCHPEGDEAHGATFRHEKVVQPIAVGKAVLQAVGCVDLLLCAWRWYAQFVVVSDVVSELEL